MSDDASDNLQALTAQIVSAHLSSSDTDIAEIPNLIRSVYDALAHAGHDHTHGHGSSHDHSHSHGHHGLTPAVPIEKSVFPDWIVCLEDGKKLKMLKRHLMSAYRMTVYDYRSKWGLPPSYPMVAPNYAASRSALAKKSGLGRGFVPPPSVRKVAAKKAPAKKTRSKRSARKAA